MSSTPRILAFSGSSRQGSLNGKLLAEALRLGAEMDADFKVIDLRDYPMPIYDGDLEKRDGAPPAAGALKRLIQEHDALLIATPEHNNTVTALLKNTIDWLSRPGGDDDPRDVLSGKVAGLISASPGRFGGAFSVHHLRAILKTLDVWVIPAQCSIAGAHQAFNDDGTLKDERSAKSLHTMLKELVRAAGVLRTPDA